MPRKPPWHGSLFGFLVRLVEKRAEHEEDVVRASRRLALMCVHACLVVGLQLHSRRGSDISCSHRRAEW